jgi:hypothetical protein
MPKELTGTTTSFGILDRDRLETGILPTPDFNFP